MNQFKFTTSKGGVPTSTIKNQKLHNFKGELKMETEFKQYRRKQIAELREVTDNDIRLYKADDTIPASFQFNVSISDADLKNGSPKIGDKIARNPKNHNDQWLVAEQYFKDNFEKV